MCIPRTAVPTTCRAVPVVALYICPSVSAHLYLPIYICPSTSAHLLLPIDIYPSCAAQVLRFNRGRTALQPHVCDAGMHMHPRGIRPRLQAPYTPALVLLHTRGTHTCVFGSLAVCWLHDWVVGGFVCSTVVAVLGDAWPLLLCPCNTYMHA